MEKIKKSYIPFISLICCILIISMVGCSKNDSLSEENAENKNQVQTSTPTQTPTQAPTQAPTQIQTSNNVKESISGDWKTEIMEDEETFNKLKEGIIEDWYDESYYITGNTIKDIKIFKSPNDENDFYWIANADIYVKKFYTSNGLSYYQKSNDTLAELKNVYLLGWDLFNDEYEISFRGFDVESYDNALNRMLVGLGHITENELICVVDDKLSEDIKNSVRDNDNIYSKMENLLKRGKLEDARNMYYQNTKLTKAQSEKCLLLYIQYYYLDYSKLLIQYGHSDVEYVSTNTTCLTNTSTEEENDYWITVQIRYRGYDYFGDYVYERIEDNYVVNIDVDNKTYTENYDYRFRSPNF